MNMPVPNLSSDAPPFLPVPRFTGIPGQERTSHFQFKAIIAARAAGLRDHQAVVFIAAFLAGPALDWCLALVARDSEASGQSGRFFRLSLLNDLQFFMEALGEAFPDRQAQ